MLRFEPPFETMLLHKVPKGSPVIVGPGRTVGFVCVEKGKGAANILLALYDASQAQFKQQSADDVGFVIVPADPIIRPELDSLSLGVSLQSVHAALFVDEHTYISVGTTWLLNLTSGVLEQRGNRAAMKAFTSWTLGVMLAGVFQPLMRFG
jgi:hypothetical protein